MVHAHQRRPPAGGTFQLEGNAGGDILECDRPRRFRVTFGADTSFLEVRLVSRPGTAPRRWSSSTRCRSRWHRAARARCGSAPAGTAQCLGFGLSSPARRRMTRWLPPTHPRRWRSARSRCGPGPMPWRRPGRPHQSNWRKPCRSPWRSSLRTRLPRTEPLPPPQLPSAGGRPPRIAAALPAWPGGLSLRGLAVGDRVASRFFEEARLGTPSKPASPISSSMSGGIISRSRSRWHPVGTLFRRSRHQLRHFAERQKHRSRARRSASRQAASR